MVDDIANNPQLFTLGLIVGYILSPAVHRATDWVWDTTVSVYENRKS